MFGIKQLIKNIIILLIFICVCIIAFSFRVPLNSDDKELESYKQPTPTQDVDAIEKTLRIAVVSEDYVYESWPIMDELYALANMKVTYKTIRPDSWQDTMGKILASGDLYDMMELDAQNAQLYKAQLFDVSPYLEINAPNYLKYASKYSVFLSNYYYGQPITHFPFREDTNVLKSAVFVSNTALGKDAMNLEEFFSFMEGSSLTFRGSTHELVEMMAPYFGTSTYWHTDDAQDVYGPTSEGFRNMLRQLKIMYDAGIISSDFLYAPPTEFTESIISKDASMALATESDFEWLYEKGYTPVMLNFTENAYAHVSAHEPSKYGSIIAGTGKEMDALHFLDVCFSKEGRSLLNYGVNSLHTQSHTDGAIEYLEPYTQSGTYQWKQQGLTPEGLPGIYYNSWARFEDNLLEDLIPLRAYLPKKDFLLAANDVMYTSYTPKLITKQSVENVQYEWWSAFINGEKSVDWDWGEYLAQMAAAGCTQGYN